MGTTNNNHKKRLRKRYAMTGLEGFHDYEVLELILSYSHVRKDTKQLAKNLIKKFKNITDVFLAPSALLQEVDGIGERSASLLKLFRDVNCYYMKNTILNKNFIKSSQNVYDYLKNFYKGRKIEEFKVIFLNNKNMIISEETLFTGTVNEAKIYIRNLIEHVIRYSASGIIIVHNHPSGNLKPSPEDLNITSKIKKALALIDVRLLDHLIIGDNDYISFNGEGLLG